MALQKSYTDSKDHTDASAYHRIDCVNLCYSGLAAVIIVLSYKDSTAATDKDPTARRDYDVTGSTFTDVFGATAQDTVNKNIQESAYIHLKTLADFTSATDV